MLNKSLINSLRYIVFGTTLCGIVIYGVMFPVIGVNMINDYPEFSNWFYPWLIFLWLTSIPCFSVLFLLWKILDNIKNNNIFSYENARKLKYNSRITIVDTVFFLIGNNVFLVLNMSHPAVLLCSLIIVFAGISISVVFEALSRLAEKAAQLQEENNLTI